MRYIVIDDLITTVNCLVDENGNVVIFNNEDMAQQEANYLQNGQVICIGN